MGRAGQSAKGDVAMQIGLKPAANLPYVQPSAHPAPTSSRALLGAGGQEGADVPGLASTYKSNSMKV